MERHPAGSSRRHRSLRLVLGCVAVVALLVLAVSPAAAADEPNTPPGLALDARVLMGGNVRPGAWAAVSVEVANDGPALNGELRVRTPQAGRSIYGIAVQLPGTSRQQYTLYAQPPLFGTRLHVDLVSGGRIVATRDVAIQSHDAYAPIIAVLAERPEGLLAGVKDAAQKQAGREFEMRAPNVITISLADLPPRVEAWSAIDRLVWQDVDAGQLSTEQRDALRLWLHAGGRLIVVGGTTGSGTVSGFPEDLLPFMPTTTLDVPAADLASLTGSLPADVTSVPSLGGTLRAGSVWARSGDHVIAAQSSAGQGSVTVVGVNPAEAWLADSAAGRALWQRLLPAGAGAQVKGINLSDDSMLLGVLQMLPSIDLPPIEQLFLLLFAYVALIGPVNYLVLRRLDRREWAWITMPALVAVFAVGSYGMGASLKGSDVIVNEVAIVRAAEGSDRGIGQVYVGVFSPSRRTFDVRIGDGALLTNPTSQDQFGQTQQPLDVLFGEKSRLRNFEVGFGVLRGFRAEAPAAAPVIESDLHLSRGRLQGTITNRSQSALENVAVAYAGGVAVLNTLDAGETASVTVDTSGAAVGYQLSERIFGATFPREEAQARVVYTRRTVIEQLANYGSTVSGANAGAPVLLAWRPGPVLDVELVGEQPNRVGDSLVLVPLSMAVDREAVFNDQMIAKTVLESTTGEPSGDGSSFYLVRGSMTVELRPSGLSGGFNVRSLELALTDGSLHNMRGDGTPVAPLPEHEQPDQDDPVGDGGGGGGGEGEGEPGPAPWAAMPNLQLFDHAAQRWLEFPAFVSGRAYLIEEPARYVDDAGRVVARLVNRAVSGEEKYFSLVVRLEGTIE